ncbi:MAG: hypothetical protein ACIAQZ_00375 [Sedimentisphaeraceae bacterium JB056]
MQTRVVVNWRFYFFSILLIFFLSPVLSAVEWGDDILDGTGDFEIQGETGIGPCTIWADGGQISEIVSSLPYSGTYSWHGESTSGGENIRVWWSDIETAGNRQHKLIVYARKQVSSPSWFRYRLGDSGWQDLSLLFTDFIKSEKYYTTGTDEDVIDLTLGMYSNSANDNVYADKVALYRERCMPDPNDDSCGGILPCADNVTVSIYCSDGNDGTYNYNFDNDVTVICDEAVINYVNWVDDKEIQVNLTVTAVDSNVCLVLINQYSDLKAEYVMSFDTYGANIFDSAGGFEFDGGSGPWTLWADGGESSTISSNVVSSGSYAWKAGPAVSAGKNIRAWTTLNTFGNRLHKIVAYARCQDSSPSWARARIGSDSWDSSMDIVSNIFNSFAGTTLYQATDVDEVSPNLTVAVYTNSTNDTLYVDDIAVYRERCIPDPNSDSFGGVLPYDQRVTLSIYGAQRSNGTFWGSFDPDITVTCTDADIHSVTWISDTQIDVELTVEDDQDGAIELVLRNEYSCLETSYMMNVGSYGVDLLTGEGNFESQGASGVGPWTFWADGGQVSEITDTLSNSGMYSWHGGSTASSKQARAYYQDIETVANRYHTLELYARQGVSSPSWLQYSLGSSGWQSLGLAWTYFAYNYGYYLTGSAEDEIDLVICMYSNSADDNVYVDDVTLKRERCIPEPCSDSFGGVLPYGQNSQFTVYCDGESDGSFCRLFDPDIQMSSSQATINSVTWVDDYTVTVNMFVTCESDQDVELTLTNVYSGLSSIYTMKNIYGADLLSGNGDFDDPDETNTIGDRTYWLTSICNTADAGFTTSDYCSSNWSWFAEGASTADTASLTNRTVIDTVASREYLLALDVKDVSTPSTFTATIGQGSAVDIDLTLNQWVTDYICYDSNSQETELDLAFDMQSSSSGSEIYVDNVSLRRERAVPCPYADSLNGVLPYEQFTTVSIYGETGFSGNVLKAFDPDIEVVSDYAYIESVTWVSDTRIDVNLAAFYGGDIKLTLINKYSEMSAVYFMTSNLTPAVFTLDSNEFPVIFMDVGEDDSDLEIVRDCGVTHVQRWDHSSLDVANSITELSDYMDLAEEHGMKVMVNLRLRKWVLDPNGVDNLEQIATAVKNHDSMSFWFLEDEPESYDIVCSQITDFYTMLKTLTPDIPVAMGHCQKHDPDWWGYSPVEDVFITNRYPVNDEIFPTAPADSATNWFSTAASTSPDEVMASLQLHNRLSFGVGAWDNITLNNRFPNQTEVRYWNYAMVIQGARGLEWYSYGRSITPILNEGEDDSWLRETFAPAGREFRKFVFATKPCHDPNVILEGGSTTDNLFMAVWERTLGSWVVLVNGTSQERQVSIDTTGYIQNAILTPWGLSRDLQAEISDSELNINIKPWETIIWQVE